MFSCQFNRLISYLEKTEETKDFIWNRQSRVDDWIPGWVRHVLLTGAKQSTQYWIDVYCIPLESEGLELKRTAISQMTPIYSGAELVLMIDQTLTAVDCTSNLNEDRIMAKIAKSPWMGRCWTLQESSLAAGIVYQLCQDQHFTDSSDVLVHSAEIFSLSESLHHTIPVLGSNDRISHDLAVITRQTAVGQAFSKANHYFNLRGKYMSMWVDSAENLMLASTLLVPACRTGLSRILGNKVPDGWQSEFSVRLSVYLDRMRSTRILQKKLARLATTMSTINSMLSDRDIRLILVWNAFIGRSTTMKEDVHCILANMLDFHAEQVLDLPLHVRFKAMLCAQDRLPLELLFSQANADPSAFYKDRWVPHYPIGFPLDPVETKLGFAEPRVNSGLLLHLEAGLKKVAPYKIPSSAPRVLNFRIQIDNDVFWVRLHNTVEFPEASNQSSQRYLILGDERSESDNQSSQHELVQLSGYIGTGAMLVHEECQGTTLKAIYDSSISWGCWEPSMSRSWPSFCASSVIPCQRLDGLLNIRLDTGMDRPQRNHYYQANVL